jgi:hypothetical protein
MIQRSVAHESTGGGREIQQRSSGSRSAPEGQTLALTSTHRLPSEVGQPFWIYDMVEEVDEGEIVLHYDRQERAIIAWSLTVGSAWRDTVVWAARGTYARDQNIQPHERPGWRLSLHGPVLLSKPLA